MALSRSIGKAQTPAVCQFCEESTEIKWKCINCELFLCQLCCSMIHNKIKASMEHEIINLKQVETEGFATSMRKVELENMVCTIHAKQKCFDFCEDCSQPACSKCLIETHKMHDYKALQERYNEIISEMKELTKSFQSNIEIFRSEEDTLQKVLSDGNTNFQETKDMILQNKKKMIEAISKHAKDILQELDAKWKPSENMIKTELSVILKNIDKLETRKKDIIQALQSQKVLDIFSTIKNLDKSLPKRSVKKIQPNKTKFIPRNVQSQIISQSMLGDLYIVPDLELIDTYQSNNRGVTTILSCSDNTAFIGSSASETLQKVKFENQEIKVEQEIQISANDMSWKQDGEILESTGGSAIKLYTKDKQLKIFKDFSPLSTSCVHVTKDNRIIVGLLESFPVVSNKRIRRLVVMNQDGDIQHTIEYQRLFTFPRRIDTFNDRIVVVDFINTDLQGRVVMLDYGGQLHWTYKDCNISNSDQAKFYPKDVAITSSNMILVSDCKNHAIHVLNPAGDVIVCKDIQSLGIEFPWSLEYDHNDVLWIGCIYKVFTDKSKIHCVKLT